MKKILITTGIFPPDIGGPATYAKMLADRWGNQAVILTYTKGLRRVPKPFRQLVYLIRAWFGASQVDAIYSLSALGTGLASAIVASWRNKPLVVRVAGDRVWEDAVIGGKTMLMINDFQRASRTGWIKRRHQLQVWVCERAVRVIVPSHYLAEIVKGWGIDEQKISVIYNSVSDFTLGKDPESKEEARKRIGIPGKIIVSAGRLVPWKGFRLLIKLMPQLLEMNPFFRLVIVGDGPDRARLMAMIKNIGLSQRVFLVGKKTPAELAVYLAAADLFILNSGYEGFSHQLLEVMATGVPVITTLVGGNREVVKQGENGFMIKYNDEFNLIEAVKSLSEDEALRKHFIEQGRLTARTYQPERMLSETQAIFDQL